MQDTRRQFGSAEIRAPLQLACPTQVPEPVAGAVSSLTRRELQALALKAQGLSYKDIGKEMFISWHTVASHLDAARYKLGARNSVHAACIALSRGLVEL